MVRGVGPPTSEGTGGKRDACKGEVGSHSGMLAYHAVSNSILTLAALSLQACAIQTCLANEGYNMSR